MSAKRKLAVLASTSFLCAVTTAFVAIVVMEATLSPTDMAYGMTLGETLRDPFVQTGAVIYGAFGWFLGFPLSTLLLWRSNLARSIPIVFIVAVGTAALAAPVLGPLSAVPALMLTGFCMFLFWVNSRAQADRSRSLGPDRPVAE